MLGNGHISQGQIWIYINTKNDRKYISYVKGLLETLFGISPGCYCRRKKNMVELFLSSVDLIKYLKGKGISVSNKVRSQVDIPQWIFTKNSFKKSFLRGFFDTDGSIYKLRFGIQMSFTSRSVPLLQSTRKILLSLRYHPSRVTGPKLYLTKRADLYRYITEIGFGNRKHLKRAKNFGVT